MIARRKNTIREVTEIRLEFLKESGFAFSSWNFGENIHFKCFRGFHMVHSQ